MDFKRTKVTAPHSTGGLWRKWVLPSTTEKPSRGYSTEILAQRFLKNNGWEVLFHDVEIMHVQIDLLARDSDGVLSIIEVKKQTPFGSARVSPRQARRLLRVGQFLGEFEPVQMRVAFVQDQTVSLLPVDALTGF